jgi:hypothetical protein
MDFITEILNIVGLRLDENTPEIVKFCLIFLILSCFILLNVVNIGIYLLSIFILSHDKILSKIPINYKFIHKGINYYKNIRIGFIVFEFILLVIALFILIIFSYGIVSYYLHIK